MIECFAGRTMPAPRGCKLKIHKKRGCSNHPFSYHGYWRASLPGRDQSMLLRAVTAYGGEGKRCFGRIQACQSIIFSMRVRSRTSDMGPPMTISEIIPLRSMKNEEGSD